jgi:hypothetical protein
MLTSRDVQDSPQMKLLSGNIPDDVIIYILWPFLPSYPPYIEKNAKKNKKYLTSPDMPGMLNIFFDGRRFLRTVKHRRPLLFEIFEGCREPWEDDYGRKHMGFIHRVGIYGPTALYSCTEYSNIVQYGSCVGYHYVSNTMTRLANAKREFVRKSVPVDMKQKKKFDTEAHMQWLLIDQNYSPGKNEDITMFICSHITANPGEQDILFMNNFSGINSFTVAQWTNLCRKGCIEYHDNERNHHNIL